MQNAKCVAGNPWFDSPQNSVVSSSAQIVRLVDDTVDELY